MEHFQGKEVTTDTEKCRLVGSIGSWTNLVNCSIRSYFARGGLLCPARAIKHSVGVVELIGASLLHPGRLHAALCRQKHLVRRILLPAVCIDALNGADGLEEGDRHCDVVG